MVNAIFKPDSAARSVIRKSETFQDLPLLWKLFSDHDLSYSTVQDALTKIKASDEKSTKTVFASGRVFSFPGSDLGI